MTHHSEPARERKHVTRMSDSSHYDEVCTVCGATDAMHGGTLHLPCPGPSVSASPAPAAGGLEAVRGACAAAGYNMEKWLPDAVVRSLAARARLETENAQAAERAIASPAETQGGDGVREALESLRAFIEKLVGLVGDADYAYEEKGELDALTHFGQMVGEWRFDGTFASYLDEIAAALAPSTSAATPCNLVPPPETYGGSADEPWTGRMPSTSAAMSLSEVPEAVIVAMGKRLNASYPQAGLDDDDIAALFLDGYRALGLASPSDRDVGEPVAWQWRRKFSEAGDWSRWEMGKPTDYVLSTGKPVETRPLYTHPAPAVESAQAVQITMGRGLVDVTQIDHEGRSGILFRPRDQHIPVGSDGELQAGEYWPVAGDVVIWIENQGGAQVIQNYLGRFLSPAVESAQVKVKPLVWTEPAKLNNGCWTADSILGTYSVAFDDGWHACLEDGIRWEWEPEHDPRSYDGPGAGQAACQAHLASKIRASLDLATDAEG